jgi:hypothetical protein
MPQVVARAWVPIPPALAFAVSQTHGAVRLRWDPFISAQRFVGAARAAKGVRTITRTRLGLAMESEYASFRPPTSVGMTMVRGPWFLERFGGGWRFAPEARVGVEGTLATWNYTFTARPAWLRPLADRIGAWLLGREIRARLAGFAAGCADEVVLAAAREELGEG